MGEKKAYVYANKEEQMKRVNRFFVMGYIVFYSLISIIIIGSMLRGIRTIGYTSMLLAIIALVTGLTTSMYFKNKVDPRIKYICSIGLLFITFMIGFAYDNYYLRFMSAIPLVGNIVTFDRKFSAIFGIAISVLNIFITSIKVFITQIYVGEAIIDNWCATLGICILMALIYLTVNIAKTFNEDTMRSLEDEKAAQKQILDDVIEVAEQVRKETENAMGIVNVLNESTEVVNASVGDIAESTQSTAQNIQTQTVMTSNIQDAIQQTLEKSEGMVQVANESETLNHENLKLMETLKKHSAIISDINSNVAEMMKKLQERTHAVKGITDTIFSISKQTNLLALNASIESARAGEAGKGFVVVAEEIRKLAEKTRQETENIELIVSELAVDSEQVADTINHSVSETRTQDELIGKASKSFEEINRNVNKLIEDIADIDRMLSSLSEANNQIVENIMHLSSATEEVTAASTQAAELSVKNLDHAEHTKNTLNKILNRSYQLDKYLNH